MRIGTKLLGGLAAIAATGMLAAIFTFISVERERALLADMQVRFKTVSEKYFVLSSVAKEIQFNVVQVQQFLQDVSATRGEDGLDDGWKQADEQAKLFAENVRKADAIAAELKLTEVHKQLEDMRKAFGPFYAAGQTMAEAYVKGGPKSGNPLMNGFDEIADQIQSETGALQKQTARLSADSIAGYGVEMQQVMDRAQFLSFLAIGAAIVALVVCTVTGLMIRFSVLQPLARMTDAMLSLARGDFSTQIPGQGSADEIGEMAEAVAVFKKDLSEAEAMRAAQADKDREQAEMRRQAVHALADTFEHRVGEMVRGVATAAAQLQSTAETMTNLSENAQAQAASASSSTELTTANTASVAAATEELSASFSEISSRTNLSITAVEEAVQHSQSAVVEVKRLDDSARKIGEVVNLISDIAEQTSLLALNATIEAARAGDAGRGFAVVASEVKALATQTAKATGEVDAQVRSIQSAVNKSASAMSSVSDSITRVRTIAGDIASAVETQSTATTEIARNVGEASRGSAEIRSNVEGVRSSASETGVSARQVLAAARELSQCGETLTKQVDSFLREVRAA